MELCDKIIKKREKWSRLSVLEIALMTLCDEERDFVTMLLDKYGDLMYSKAMAILKNKQDAMDAVQETFYKIIKHIDKFEGSADKHKEMLSMVEIGLSTSIQNTAKRHYNKNKRKIENKFSAQDNGGQLYVDIEDSSANIEDNFIRKEEYKIAKAAIMKLSSDLQDAVYLVYTMDFSYKEASDYLDISLSALKDRIYRAKKKLKEILNENNGEKNE